jgi:hypothetical protein
MTDFPSKFRFRCVEYPPNAVLALTAPVIGLVAVEVLGGV